MTVIMTDSRLYPEWFLEKLTSITDARPKKVIEMILEYGQVTTEQLQAVGYEHAPRAARDVRERGIPLETIKVRNSANKPIAAYKFPDDLPEEAGFQIKAGRKQFPKSFKSQLIMRDGEKCAVCSASLPASNLQIDHKVPYEIGGDTDSLDDHMLLCSSCNRVKSWTCEHCPNWNIKDPKVCPTCYWASPLNYRHVATLQQRRMELVWNAEETVLYDQIVIFAAREKKTVTDYVKALLSKSN